MVPASLLRDAAGRREAESASGGQVQPASGHGRRLSRIGGKPFGCTQTMHRVRRYDQSQPRDMRRATVAGTEPTVQQQAAE